jgi:hypothetical protein
VVLPEIYPLGSLHPNKCLLAGDYAEILAIDCPHITLGTDYDYEDKADLWDMYNQNYRSIGKLVSQWYELYDKNHQKLSTKSSSVCAHCNTVFCIIGGSIVEDIKTFVEDYPDYSQEFCLRGLKNANIEDLVWLMNKFEREFTTDTFSCFFMVIPTMSTVLPMSTIGSPDSVDRQNNVEVDRLFECLLYKNKNRVSLFTPWTTSHNIPWFPLHDCVKEDPNGAWKNGQKFRDGGGFCQYIHPHPNREWFMTGRLCTYINNRNQRNGSPSSHQHECHMTTVNTGGELHYYNLIKSHFKEENEVTQNKSGYITQLMDRLSFLGIGFLWKEASMKKFLIVIKMQNNNMPRLDQWPIQDHEYDPNDRSGSHQNDNQYDRPSQNNREQPRDTWRSGNNTKNQNNYQGQNSRQFKPEMSTVRDKPQEWDLSQLTSALKQNTGNQINKRSKVVTPIRKTGRESPQIVDIKNIEVSLNKLLNEDSEMASSESMTLHQLSFLQYADDTCINQLILCNT